MYVKIQRTYNSQPSFEKEQGLGLTPLILRCTVCAVCLAAQSFSTEKSHSDSLTLWTAAPQASLSMGIVQARILEWVAMPSSRSSQSRDLTQASHIACRFFTI